MLISPTLLQTAPSCSCLWRLPAPPCSHPRRLLRSSSSLTWGHSWPAHQVQGWISVIMSGDQITRQLGAILWVFYHTGFTWAFFLKSPKSCNLSQVRSSSSPWADGDVGPRAWLGNVPAFMGKHSHDQASIDLIFVAHQGDLPLLPGASGLGAQTTLCLHQLTAAVGGLHVRC